MIRDIGKVLDMLRDFSFKELITPLIVKVLYLIGVIVAIPCVFVQVANGFAITEGRGFLMLFFSPLLYLFYVMVLRIALEIVMALFYRASGTPVVIATGSKPVDQAAPAEEK